MFTSVHPSICSCNCCYQIARMNARPFIHSVFLFLYTIAYFSLTHLSPSPFVFFFLLNVAPSLSCMTPLLICSRTFNHGVSIPQSRIPGTVIPLCAAQCERIFNTTRIPGEETGKPRRVHTPVQNHRARSLCKQLGCHNSWCKTELCYIIKANRREVNGCIPSAYAYVKFNIPNIGL